MYTWIIAGAVVLAAFGVLLFKLTKSIAKAIFFSASILLLAIIAFSAVLFMDVNDLKDNLGSRPNLMIMESGGNAVAAISGVFTEQQSLQSVSNDELAVISSNYKQGNMGAALNGNYKMLVIKESVFSSVGSLTVGDSELSREQVMKLLNSDKPIDDYIDMISEPGTRDYQKAVMRQGIVSQVSIKDEAGFKGHLFMVLLNEVSQKKGPMFLIQGIKTDEVMIYRETIALKLLRYLPESLTSQVLKISSV